YVEGLGHNLFSVGQFCDSDLEVEAVATACFTQNRSIIRLRHEKTPYELLHSKLPDLSFFHVFGALCYPTNDSENLGKLQPKADIGIFIGYALTKKAFRIYNRCTRRIVETIYVDFDELTAMASEQSSSGPALNDMTPGTISSPSSTTVNQDAPSPSKSLTTTEIQSTVIPQDVGDDNLDMEVAHMGNDPLLGVPIPEVTSEQSSSTASPQSNVQPNHPMTHHNNKWTKDHPLNNIIGQLSRPVSTRLQLYEQALFCYYDAFLTSVWELVPRPDQVMVITLKWIYKVKLDELGGILKNKDRLVARGYCQEEGIDFEESFALDLFPVVALFALALMEFHELVLAGDLLSIEYPTKIYGSSFSFILSKFSPSLDDDGSVLSIACGCNASAQKNKGSFKAESIVRAASTRVQFCLLTMPFCSGVRAVENFVNSSDPTPSNRPTKVKVPKELSKVSMAVEQHRLESKTFAIKMNKVLNDNERLLEQVISKDIVNIIVNSSMDNTSVYVHECEKCLKLRTELLNKKDFLEKETYDKLFKSFTTLEKHCISLEVDSQLNREIFKRDNPVLNQSAPSFDHYFELNELKAQSQEKDTVISKLKERIKSLSVNNKEDKIKKDLEEIETINIELDHRDDLRKLKEKALVDDAITSHSITPEMLNVNVEPFAFKLLNNRIAHSDYLRHTQEKAVILREIVKQGKSLNPLNNSLDHAFWKPTGKVFTNIGYIWRPTGRTFTIVGNACPLSRITTTTEVVQIVLCYLDSGCSKHMTGDHSQLTNSVNKFLGTVKFGNDHVFCDSNLEVAFLQHTYFIRNLEGVDLLTESRARHGLVRGLPKLKFEKDHLCSIYAMGKSKKKPYKPKSEDTNQEILYLLHMDLCGPMRVTSVNGKKYILVIIDDYSRFTWVGISHETSVACSLQQNGVVERHNHMLIEAARIMLIYAKALLFLWAEAVAIACYTQNRSLIRLRHEKTPYELLHNKPPDLSFLYVFGALCYPTNDSENLGKLQPKADIDFDELTAMAYEQSSSGPALHEMTPATISSGLVPNAPSSTLVDHPTPKVIASIAEVVSLEPAALTSSPSLTTVDQDAPSPSNSQTTPETQSSIIPNDVEDNNHDLDVAHMNNDPFFGIPIPEVPYDQSSSTYVTHTIVHPDHQISKHNKKWTKDHPLDNIISKIARPISTRIQLHDQALFYYYDAFLTSVEQNTYKDALTQSCWIKAMQEKLNEF
nr:hypothetical protein [Tanacetum cinerariifolium]